MVFGFALFAMGYVLFYWGLHHMPGTTRYGMWTLLGLDAIYAGMHKGAHLADLSATGGMAFPPVQIPVANPTDTQTQQSSNGYTPTPLKSGAVSPLGPSKANFRVTRTDQGVDFGGSGPLYAVGSGTIINVYNTGWPNGVFIVLKLDKPPAGLPSPDIYYAEGIIPLVSVGQHVNAGDLIGRATGASTGIELGFADPNAIGRALAASQFTGNNATALGQQFKKWIGA